MILMYSQFDFSLPQISLFGPPFHVTSYKHCYTGHSQRHEHSTLYLCSVTLTLISIQGFTMGIPGLWKVSAINNNMLIGGP